MSLSDHPDLDLDGFEFNGDFISVHTPLENLDENQDSRTVAVMVSDPIYSTDSSDSTDSTNPTDSTDSSDAEYRKVINDATKDHVKKHWIKIKDTDSDGPSLRAKWLTELLDKLKNEWPKSFGDNTSSIGLLRTSIVVSFSNSFLLVEHLKV